MTKYLPEKFAFDYFNLFIIFI